MTKFIGNILREYRSIISMSRKELAENICSEKYIYLIEKGERSPSVEMTIQLGEKLGVDLFQYNNFIDCQNPVYIQQIMLSFEKYRRESDLVNLIKLTETAEKIQDFNKEPWVYEIKINHLVYKVLYKQEPEQAIEEIYNVLSSMGKKYRNSSIYANLYVLLSTSYQMKSDLAQGKLTAMKAYDAVCDKKRLQSYTQVFITTMINLVTVSYISCDYETVISRGLELWEYQHDRNCVERAHHTFFYLSYAYYKLGKSKEAMEWFMKGLYTLLIHYKPMDAYYLANYDVFQELIQEKTIPDVLINQFREMYI